MNATTESKKDGPVLVHWYIRTSLLLKSFVLGGSIQRLQYLYISMGSSKKSLTSFFGAHFIQVQVCKRQLGKTSFSSCMSLLYKVATVCIHATGASKELSAFHRHLFSFSAIYADRNVHGDGVMDQASICSWTLQRPCLASS